MQTLLHSLPEGTLIGDRFEVRSVLGVGGFGITYKGWDRHLACEVAIKEYLPLEFAARSQGDVSVRAHSTRSDDYRYGLQRFLDEARTLARFKHPNVVRVANFLESNGTAYLVMDYEEGESLGQYLKRTVAPLTETQVRGIAEPILRGLAVVHAQGFLHRDVKPGNIYLRREGEPLLIDFGAARQALGEHSRSVTGIVSAGYAPPEQYSTDAKKQGPWTDLYGLGATLYRCISGEDPVDSLARREAQAEGEPDPLRPAVEVGRGRYAPELLTLVDRLLALSPKQRPGTAAEVLDQTAASRAPMPHVPYRQSAFVAQSEERPSPQAAPLVAPHAMSQDTTLSADVGEPRRVEATRGLGWLVDGWKMFAQAPGEWLVLTLVCAALLGGTALVMELAPVLGAIAVPFAMVLVMAGSLRLGRAQQDGIKPSVSQFSGTLLDARTRKAVVATLLYFFSYALVFVVLGGMIGALQGVMGGDFDGAPMAFLGLLLILLLTAIVAGYWYLLPLVLFRNIPLKRAIKVSFSAVRANGAPLLAYGIVTAVLGVLAQFPFYLGFFLLFPVTMLAWVSSFRDAFPD